MARFRIPEPAHRIQVRVRDETHALRKWVGLGALVGLSCGAAAVAFLWMIKEANLLLLSGIAGYQDPDGGAFHLARPWLLPLVPALGGLLGGLLVWRLAPDASGIGTDAAIRAFHAGRPIKLRTTAVKLVASALTIGSGGTSGREGPIAQVGAGTGSALAGLLRLSTKERGIAMAAGLGAGIAAMFKAPLAGTLIAAEVFYREDFEVEALVPTLVASVVGYSVVGFIFGWQPVFHTALDPFRFGALPTLALYAVLGIACGLLARLGIAAFFPLQRRFSRLPLPLATTLGGLAVGLLALASVSTLGIAPSVGTGAAWLQEVLDHVDLGSALPLSLLFLAAAGTELAGILLTLGSGGSGGIFGPSLVVGGFLGAAFGSGFHSYMPALVPDLAPFAIVGMIAYFAAFAKAPIGTIVMVVEMTGGYGLLGPAMVATMFSFLLSGHGSMFASQVRNRLASPAHAAEFEATVLHRHLVRDIQMTDPPTVARTTPVPEALAFLQKTDATTLVVVDDGRLVATCTLRDLQRVPEADRANRVVEDVLVPGPDPLVPGDDLFKALSLMLQHDLHAVPVVADPASRRLAGLVTRRHVAGAMNAARGPQPAPKPLSRTA